MGLLFTSLDELVPEDHLVRKLENAIDWRFIYEMVEDSYCEDNGRPSLDPVILIKLPVIQYMFGIRSMRQTIQEIKVNTAYRWLHRGREKLLCEPEVWLHPNDSGRFGNSGGHERRE